MQLNEYLSIGRLNDETSFPPFLKKAENRVSTFWFSTDDVKPPGQANEQ